MQTIAKEMNLSETAFIQEDKTNTASTGIKIIQLFSFFFHYLPFHSNQIIVSYSSYKTFFVGKKFGLRWFTPTNEVNLCGHATLASAAVLFYHYKNSNSKLEFVTLSGTLTAENIDGKITLDLPISDLDKQVSVKTIIE